MTHLVMTAKENYIYIYIYIYIIFFSFLLWWPNMVHFVHLPGNPTEL